MITIEKSELALKGKVIAALKKAVEFYGNEESWVSSSTSEGQTEICDEDVESLTHNVDEDLSTDLFGGKLARATLLEVEKMCTDKFLIVRER